jgi:hypothetical protein
VLPIPLTDRVVKSVISTIRAAVSETKESEGECLAFTSAPMADGF